MAKKDVKIVENVVAAIEKRFGSKTPGGPGGGAQAVETPSGANDAILNAQIDRLVETLSNNMATVVGTVFCSSPAKAIQDLKPGMFFQELEKQLQTVVAGQASPKAETKQSVDVVLSASDSTLSETVAKLSEASPEGLESLNGFITQLDTISKMEVGNLDEVVTSLSKINDIKLDKKNLENVDKFIEQLHTLNDLELKDFEKNTENINKNITAVRGVVQHSGALYSEAGSITKNIIGKNKGSIKSIVGSVKDESLEVMKSINETDAKMFEAAMDNLNQVSLLIVTSAAVMLLGGFIMLKFPQVIAASFQFGIQFAMFLGVILAPIVLVGVVAGKFNASFKDFESISKFIMTAAVIMILGGLCTMIPIIAQGSMQFGPLFSQFLFTLLLPLGILIAINGIVKGGCEGLQELSVFLLAVAGLMIIGGLFTLIPTFAVHSLQFGAIFSAFLMSLMLPLLLMALIARIADANSIDAIGDLVIKMAIIMSVGALFMLWGKFPQLAIQFGIVLAQFLATVMIGYAVGYLLIGLFGGFVADNIADLITRAAIIMSIGALFMMLGGGKFAVNAIAFGILLAVFTAIVILPLKLLATDPFFVKSLLTMIVFKRFISSMARILLIAGLLMLIPGFTVNVIAFGLILTIFCTMMVGVMKLVDIALGIGDFQDVVIFTSFVSTLAFVLLLGALVMLIPGVTLNCIVFALILGLFVLEMVGIMKILSMAISKNTLAEAGMFTILVGVLGLVLILGALVIGSVGVIPVLAFAGLCLLFVAAMAFVFKLLTMSVGKKSLAEITAFAAAVGILGATLAIGGWVVSHIGIGPIITFGIVVTVFVGAMMAVFWALSKKMGNKSLADVIRFSAAVAILAGVLIIGGWVLSKVGADNIGLFAGITGAFVAAMMLVFQQLSKKMGNKSVKDVILFSAAVGILSGVLMLGAWVVSKYGAENLGIFAVIAAAFVYAMIPVIKILSKNNKTLGKAIPGAVMMAIIMGSLGVSMLLIAKAAEILNNVEWKAIGMMGAIVVAVLAISAGLAFALPYLGIAIVAAGLFGIGVMSIGAGLLIVAKAVQASKTFKASDISRISGTIKQVMGLYGGLPGPLKLLKFAAKGAMLALAIRPLVNAVDNMLRIITSLANAKIPIGWDKDGKVTGYRSVDVNKDVQMAATFIGNTFGSIPVMLSKAPTYRELWRAIIKGRMLAWVIRPLVEVVDNMLKIITALGSAKIPIAFDKDGKATGYKKIDPKTEIENAATFIGETFNMIPGILDKAPGYWDLFTIVIKARALANVMNPLSQVVTNMIKIITEMGAAKVPIAFDKDGKATGYEKVDFGKSLPAAQEFIAQVFDAARQIFRKSPSVSTLKAFAKETQALAACFQPLTNVVNNVIGIIVALGSAKVPVDFDKDGKATAYQKINVTNELKNAQEFISKVFDAARQMFAKSPNKSILEAFAKETKALGDCFQPLVGVVNNVIKIITSIASAQIPVKFDPKTGKPIKFEQLVISTEVQKAQNFITEVFTALPKLFEGVDLNELSAKVAVSQTYADLIKPVVSIVDNALNILVSIASARIPTKYDKEGKAIAWKEFILSREMEAAQTFVTEVFTAFPSFFDNISLDALNECAVKANTMLSFIVPVGDVIGKMVEILVSFSSQKIPTKYDKEGKPTGFEIFDPNSAMESVTKFIVSTFVIIPKAFEMLPDVKTMFESVVKGQLLLGMILPVLVSVSAMLKIVRKFSTMFVPTEFGPDGKPIAYEKIDPLAELPKVAAFIGGTFTIIPHAFDNLPDIKTMFKSVFKGRLALANIFPVMVGVSSMLRIIRALGSMRVPTEFDKDGKPTAYEKIDPLAELPKVAAFIGATFTIIPHAFDGTPPVEEMVKSAIKGRLSLATVLPIMVGVSSMLKIIRALGSQRVPTKFDKDGKPTAYEKIDPLAEMPKVMAFIKLTFDTIPHAFDDAPPVEEIIKSAVKGRLSLLNIMPIMVGVSSMLKIIRALGSQRVPTAFDKDGKPTKFEKIDPLAEMPKVMAFIKLTFDTIPHAFDDAPDPADLIKSFVKGNLLVLNTIPVMRGVAGMLTIIQMLGSARVPTAFDKDGKPTKYQKINLEKDLASATKFIVTTFTSLPHVFDACPDPAELIKSYVKGMLLLANVNQLVEVVTAAATALTILVSIQKKLKFHDTLSWIEATIKHINKIDNEIAALEFKTGLGTFIRITLVIKGFSKVLESVDKTFIATPALIRMRNTVIPTILYTYNVLKYLYNLDKAVSNAKYQITKEKFRTIHRVIRGFGNILEHVDDDLTATNKMVQKRNTVIPTIHYIYEVLKRLHFVSTKLNTMQFTLDRRHYNDIIRFTDRLNTIVCNIQSELNNRRIRNIDWRKNAEILFGISYTFTTFNVIKTALINLNFNGTDEAFAKLNEFIFKLGVTLTQLNMILNGNSVSGKDIGIFGNVKKSLGKDIDSILRGLITYNNCVDSIKTIILSINDTPEFENNWFNTAVDQLNEILAKINNENIEKLERQAKGVEKYVRAINSIDIRSIDKLTRLMHEINTMQEKTLNEFANQIAVKLTAALDRISTEIKTADKALKRADEIGKQRIEAINASVDKIRSIMTSSKLNINVTAKDKDVDAEYDD